MASVTYYGHVTMTYGDFIDIATGKTLVCVPGQTYSIMPASGNIRSVNMTMPSDGRFSVNSGREAIVRKKPAEENPPAGETQDGGVKSTTSGTPGGKE